MGRPNDTFLNESKIFVAACALMWHAALFAYPTPVDFDGSLMRWPIDASDGVVPYDVEAEKVEDFEEYGTLVDESAAMWNHAGGSYVSYKKVEEGQSPSVTVKLVRTLENGAFAAGYTTFDGWENGKPTHCTIYILISDDFSFTGIGKTILHELGHGLGLGHTLVPEAIMSYSLDKNKFALDIDDEAAIARLYPPDGTEPRIPPGCAVGSGMGPTQGSEAPWVRILIVIFPALLAIFKFQPISSIRSIERFARRRMSSGT